MENQMKRTILSAGLGVLIWTASLAHPAWAEVDININIGIPLPPPIVVAAPPTMVFLAEPGFYVVIGVPYDIFFIDGRYYYYRAGYWYWAPGYGGPWVHVVYKSLPPGLRKFKVVQLRQFREREFKLYKAQGPRYKGRHLIAVEGPGPKAKGMKPQGPMKPGRGRPR